MNEGGAHGRFTARVVLEDGTALPDTPRIFIVQAHDGMRAGCEMNEVFRNGTVFYSAWVEFDPTATTDACEVVIRVPGFRAKQAVLHDGSVITLKRIGETEGLAIPASSVLAPKTAASAYASGAEAMRKGKLEEAEKQFGSAVRLYPEYAQAYSDLGEALEKQNRGAEAQAAYEKALSLSPKYLKPYAQLARLEISRNAVERALEITGRALKLNPTEFPSIYYYRALALRQMQRLDEAEEGVRMAIEWDVDRQLPRAPYLLGLILEQKGDRGRAAKAFEEYARWKPRPTDADDALARAARLRALGS